MYYQNIEFTSKDFTPSKIVRIATFPMCAFLPVIPLRIILRNIQVTHDPQHGKTFAGHLPKIRKVTGPPFKTGCQDKFHQN